MSFATACMSYGLIIHDLRSDGKIHRVPTETHPRSDNGAYMFDGRGGWMMDWSRGDAVQWWREAGAKPYTDAEKAEWLRKRRADDAEKARRAHQAALRAAQMLSEASVVAPRAGKPWRAGRAAVPEVLAHPYLVAKGLTAETSLVLDGRLLVPMFLAGRYREPVGLQVIGADGETKFLPGQVAKGAVHRIGNGHRDCWLVEGYATGLSLRAALARIYSQADVVVCFSAGNLVEVAKRGIGSRVMADHDESGTGERAARDTGLPWVMPGAVGMDANDLHRIDGIESLVALVAGV